jgi:hypothetical protein
VLKRYAGLSLKFKNLDLNLDGNTLEFTLTYSYPLKHARQIATGKVFDDIYNEIGGNLLNQYITPLIITSPLKMPIDRLDTETDALIRLAMIDKAFKAAFCGLLAKKFNQGHDLLLIHDVDIAFDRYGIMHILCTFIGPSKNMYPAPYVKKRFNDS